MYLDADISAKKKRYQKLLEKNKPTRPLYSSVELWFRWYRERRVTVIGLAGSREKAEMLAAQICLDTVCREGDISPLIVRGYFEDTM